MESYKREFIQFLESAGVLKFGDFTVKSGRRVPYFINAGEIKTGAQIATLGEFYARAYQKKLGSKKAVLYGPAYKGISIAVSAAVALSKQGLNVPFFFNRKEVKDHGEGGVFVGYVPSAGEDVVITEDVITVDRMEKALNSDNSAVQEAYKEFGVKVYSIVTINDIIEAIRDGVIGGQEYLDKMIEYRKVYGVNAD